mmetsp:Transcript_93965/g.148508  ORF Transcript_93965/g.148508 Transcript_93965/m.148508 type:complete len:318 (+) Transcript_93965:116-1069(+)
MRQAAGEKEQSWRSRLLKFCSCCGDRPFQGNVPLVAKAGAASGVVPSLWSGSAQPDERLVATLLEALRNRPDGGREGSFLHDLRRSWPELNSLSEVQVIWLGANDRDQRFHVQPAVSGVSVSLTAAARADVDVTTGAERIVSSELQKSATCTLDAGLDLSSSDKAVPAAVDNEDIEFMQRILQMRKDMDAKNRRGPSHCDQVLPEFPVYGQGSPLWERRLSDDSEESDPEMPTLVTMRAGGPRENCYPLEPMADALSSSTDGFDEGSPVSPETPSSEKQGGFGACWGRDALRGALKSLDLEDSPQPRASGDIGPTLL